MLTVSNAAGSNVNRSAEITALERRLQILKQGQRLMMYSAEDDRLEELINQWREAGRTVVEKLFAIMPEPVALAATTAEASLNPPQTRSFFGDDLCGDNVEHQQGDTEQTRPKHASQHEGELADWDYGAMMSTLQVDPDLLGWDADDGDWTV